MESLLKRLEISADRIAALRQETRAEMERRDGLIAEALNQGTKYKHVSRAARRSIGTVAAIFARSSGS